MLKCCNEQVGTANENPISKNVHLINIVKRIVKLLSTPLQTKFKIKTMHESKRKFPVVVNV